MALEKKTYAIADGRKITVTAIGIGFCKAKIELPNGDTGEPNDFPTHDIERLVGECDSHSPTPAEPENDASTPKRKRAAAKKRKR